MFEFLITRVPLFFSLSDVVPETWKPVDVFVAFELDLISAPSKISLPSPSAPRPIFRSFPLQSNTALPVIVTVLLLQTLPAALIGVSPEISSIVSPSAAASSAAASVV